MKNIIIIFSFISSISFAQVEEFLPRAFSGEPVILNNKLLFNYFTPEFGTELWVTDGTAAGTQLLKDIISGGGSSNPNFSPLYVIDGYMYFHSAQTPNIVWRTNGTPQGTEVHVTNSQIFNPTGYIKCNGFILFVSRIGGNQNFWRFWRMTSFPNSEVPIINTFDGKVINNVHISSYAKKDETTLIFGGHTNQDGWAIFGTTGPTTDLIIDLYQGNNSTFNNYNQFSHARNIDGKIYFTGFQEQTGFELWTTLGSASSTNLFKDINQNNTVVNAGGAPMGFTKVGNTIFFTANDGINGREIWKTNGTAASTQMVKDVSPGNLNSGPQSLIEYNGFLYFLQSDGTNGNQIWKTDGTESGTIMVTNPQDFSNVSSANLIKTNNKLFFSGFSNVYGNELFMLDENDQVSLIADINPGINGSDPGWVIEYDGYIYFTGRFGSNINTYRTYRIATSNLNVASQNQVLASIKIFPNPTANYFTVTSDAEVSVACYSILGQKQNINQINNNQYDISHLSNGVYLLKIMDQNSNVIETRKIIKQ